MYRLNSIDKEYRFETDEGLVAFVAMSGTDVATYTRERPGMSAFALEDGVVYHAYSAYARGLDGLWGMYQWLDRAQRDGPLAPPPRRVRKGLSEIVVVVAQLRDWTSHDAWLPSELPNKPFLASQRCSSLPARR